MVNNQMVNGIIPLIIKWLFNHHGPTSWLSCHHSTSFTWEIIGHGSHGINHNMLTWNVNPMAPMDHHGATSWLSGHRLQVVKATAPVATTRAARRTVLRSGYTWKVLKSMDWFRGKFTGKTWENRWFPVKIFQTKPIH